MNDRPEGSSVLLSVVLVIVLLLVLVGGGGMAYMVLMRQQVMATREMEMAMVARERALAAEMEAKAQADRAQKLQAMVAASSADAAAPAASTAVQTTPAEPVDPQTIESVLNAQRDAWNAGDLATFMDHYWKSEELTFSSGGKTTRGWESTLARYRERYPTSAAMGKLDFRGLEIVILGDSAALVLGEWHLDREPEPLNGNFSIVLRRIADRWVIVHDHTSRLVD